MAKGETNTDILLSINPKPKTSVAKYFRQMAEKMSAQSTFILGDFLALFSTFIYFISGDSGAAAHTIIVDGYRLKLIGKDLAIIKSFAASAGAGSSKANLQAIASKRSRSLTNEEVIRALTFISSKIEAHVRTNELVKKASNAEEMVKIAGDLVAKIKEFLSLVQVRISH